MVIGLFFGSFNPINSGHLIIAQYFLNNSDIEKIWFIVSPHNPLKEKEHLLNANDRLKMVKLAIDDKRNMDVSDIEFSLPTPSFTINTLNRLTLDHPDKEFIILMGSDSINSIDEWRDYKEIINNFKIYVYPRKKHFSIRNEFRQDNIKEFDAPLIEISSTLIRENIKNGKSIKYLIPDSISDYLAALMP